MSVSLINPIPHSVCSSLSACLLLFHIYSHLSFSVLAFILGRDFWIPWIRPYSLIWIIEYSFAYCVVTRQPHWRQPEQRDVGRSQWKTDASCHVCNDRQQSAFRVPAFIIVNVDDTGLLPSWQTVMELSSLHNHWLALLWSPLNWWMPTFWEHVLLLGRAGDCVYMCMHMFVSSYTVYSNAGLLFWTCCLSDCLRQCNLDGDHYQHMAQWCPIGLMILNILFIKIRL